MSDKNYSSILANEKMVNEKNFLFNTYTVVLVIIFISNCILNCFFLKDYTYVNVFLLLVVIMLLTLFLPNKIRFNKNLLIAVFFILGLLTFYCDIAAGKGAMNYLSYISLTTAISFFFDYKRDKIIIVSLVGSYILFFLINDYTNYSLLPDIHQNLSYTEQHYVRFYKALEIIFCTLIAVYFIHRKEKTMLMYYTETENLNALLNTNKKIISRELYDMAINNSPLFMQSFNSSFPNFSNDILKLNPNVITSELEICALIMLGLKTKEIAQVTNSTVRAVENKKYRIRKKLNVPAEVDTNLFIMNSFNID
ncbi:helix-turn-helix transcriptional regulator [Chryseobacterium gambrini]|uniref:helix-turn-helix transcriptional regulator n=1 Tax=Chryseobacterium gambrini TaxID=373672 RepID=UPI0022F399FC|nr:LuxR C-terminal-related transcriptional regulator [Chryseobacterium gambrini]WBX99263.1 LuxR C-terminal-related transcriptional regulator [Chryseobacterium gambrini]